MYSYIAFFNLVFFSLICAREHLVFVEDLALPQTFHVIEQVQNRYIVIATDDELNLIRKRNSSCKVLDENSRDNTYFLVFPSIRETRENIAKTATILDEFQGGYLVKVSPENEESLFDLIAEFNYLESDKMVFQTEIPQELLDVDKTYNPEIQKIVNSVSTDSLESFIRHLQEVPSRHVNYSFLEDEAVPWICEKLEDYGCDSVYTQDVPNYNAPNVIGIKLGVKYPSYTKYYMIGGHPDAQPRRNPNYGADDNATGCAAFLEAARVFKDYTFDYTIVFMAFNAEEVGLHGSTHYAREAYNRGDSVLSVLNMERCAHVKDEARLYLTKRQSMPSTKVLADLFMQAAQTYNINLEMSYNPIELTNSDHAPFWNRGYTAIMSKEMDEPPVYHTIEDTLHHPNGANNLEFHTAVVKTGIATLAELAGLTPTNIETQGTKDAETDFSIWRLPGKQIILRTSIKPSHIEKITIYTAMGRAIKTLDIPQGKENTGIFKWDGTNVPAGVYFIELQSIYGKHYTSFLML
jgi:hypothetical protein